jgi:hypothetical protein
MLDNAKRLLEMIFNVSHFVKSSEQSKTQTKKLHHPFHLIPEISQKYFVYDTQFCIHPRPFLVEFSLCDASVPSCSYEIGSQWSEVTPMRSAALASHGRQPRIATNMANLDHLCGQARKTGVRARARRVETQTHSSFEFRRAISTGW